MGDDYRAQAYMPPAESKFDELAVFMSLEAAQSSRIMRLFVFFCKFDYLLQGVFHFVVIAGYREYVVILQVLPVLVRFVILERGTHDEDVVKMVLVFFFPHFQKVVCFFAN